MGAALVGRDTGLVSSASMPLSRSTREPTHSPVHMLSISTQCDVSIREHCCHRAGQITQEQSIGGILDYTHPL